MPEVSVSLKDNFQANTTVRGHQLRADEPTDVGGDDTGPTPVEMLLSSVGSCMAITMKLYANRKKWPLESVDLRVCSSRVKVEELDDYEPGDGRKEVTVITTQIELGGPLSEEQRTRIAEIGSRCPVHKVVELGAYFIEELAVD